MKSSQPQLCSCVCSAPAHSGSRWVSMPEGAAPLPGTAARHISLCVRMPAPLIPPALSSAKYLKATPMPAPLLYAQHTGRAECRLKRQASAQRDHPYLLCHPAQKIRFAQPEIHINVRAERQRMVWAASNFITHSRRYWGPPARKHPTDLGMRGHSPRR